MSYSDLLLMVLCAADVAGTEAATTDEPAETDISQRALVQWYLESQVRRRA